MKIRSDFVSNSSTSSYVLYSKLNPQQLSNEMWKYSGLLEESIKKWSKIFGWHLSHTTLLTLYDISFDMPLEEKYLKEFYPGESTENMIFRGYYCYDNQLSKYFDEYGEVRKDLDIDDVIAKFGMYHFEDDNIVFDQDESDGCNHGSAKINKYTIKFSKWLFEQLKKKYSNVRFTADGDTTTEIFDMVEKELAEKHMNQYWIKLNYEGDGMADDAVYYNTKKYERGDGPGYLETLRNRGVCGDVVWAENG